MTSQKEPAGTVAQAAGPTASETPQWCLGWIAGFAAAASLMAGNKAFYERERDGYLERKGWTPPAVTNS